MSEPEKLGEVISAGHYYYKHLFQVAVTPVNEDGKYEVQLMNCDSIQPMARMEFNDGESSWPWIKKEGGPLLRKLIRQFHKEHKYRQKQAKRDAKRERQTGRWPYGYGW